VAGSNTRNYRENQEPGDLLQELLLAPVPVEHEPFRPSQLRSAAEQRRIALSPFLLRTWLDTALLIVERGLIIAAVAVFGFWLIDGPARDIAHAWQNDGSRQAGAVPTAVVREARLDAPLSAPALPFTTPDMALPATPGQAQPDFLAPQPLAARPALAEQRPLRLRIERIGVDSPVIEVFIDGAAWQVADYAAGYHNGTALPGSPGNTVMAGHAGLRGAVFRDLPALVAGDEVVVETGDWRYSYRVREVKSVWPTQIEVMDPTPTPVLTLITCTNWDTQRLVVVADLVDARPLS
jgi:sortase A